MAAERDQKELKELKSVLRSLVVSSPTQVDVRSLLRDYRNMMGAPVPVAKYGYRDPMEFLRERCSDSFVFQGHPSNPILTLIVPDTLKHIDQFVQRQKVSSTVKFKGKRTSIPEQVMKQPDLIANTFVPKAVEINTRPLKRVVQDNRNTYQKPADISRSYKPIEVTTYKCDETLKSSVSNTKTCSDQNINNSVDKIKEESTTQNKENKQANSNNQQENGVNNSQNAVLNFLKKRMPLYSSSHQLESEASFDAKTSSKDDDDSGRQTSSSSGSKKASLLEELKMEIRDLIADYPDGVWCTDLIGLYRQRYNRELNFTRFGYTSIISLVSVLEDAVRVSSLDNNWLLRDARTLAADRPRRLLRDAPRPAPARAGTLDVDDALPGIDFDPDVFPVDCVHFMESIPPAPLSGLETGAMLEVMVGEVYSPSHFWLLRLGEQYNIAMEDMMDEMTQYYTYGEGKERSLALGAVRVGHYCSSVYERDWHRSLIVRRVDSDIVKVRHVDYGTVESVRAAQLKPLRRAWARLPAQAVRARLAGVRPPAAGRRWPHAASTHFLDLVRDARLVANVVAVDREEDILEVFLIDTSTEEDVCIGAEMIRSGHADARHDSALRTPECYLFPRFDVLETGETPNFGEIHAYLRDGISLEYVEEYRRHVPACLPPEYLDLSATAPAPTPSPGPSRGSCPVVSDEAGDASDEDSGTGDDRNDEEGKRESRPSSPIKSPSPCQLARAVSSPGESTPPKPPTAPMRSKSAIPNIAPSDARLEVINRVPLWPQRESRSSQPPRRLPPPPHPHLPLPTPRSSICGHFLPSVHTPLPHAISQIQPVPGYASFPPFPGAVPLYPPIYAPPPPPLLLPPHGPFVPAPYGPHHPVPRHPPASTVSNHAPHPPASKSNYVPDRAILPDDSFPSTPTSAPAHMPRAMSPPPPYNGARTRGASDEHVAAAAPNGEVTLTVSECEIFKLLSTVDANAARWYMVDAISRAMGTSTVGATASVASTLNPFAPEFQHVTAGTQTEAAGCCLPPGLRPPPGFEH